MPSFRPSAVTDAIHVNPNHNGEGLLRKCVPRTYVRTRAKATHRCMYVCGCMINSDASAGMQLRAQFKFTPAALIHGRSLLVSHKICKSIRILKYTGRSNDFIFMEPNILRKSRHYLSRCNFCCALIYGGC